SSLRRKCPDLDGGIATNTVDPRTCKVSRWSGVGNALIWTEGLRPFLGDHQRASAMGVGNALIWTEGLRLRADRDASPREISLLCRKCPDLDGGIATSDTRSASSSSYPRRKCPDLDGGIATNSARTSSKIAFRVVGNALIWTEGLRLSSYPGRSARER